MSLSTISRLALDVTGRLVVVMPGAGNLGVHRLLAIEAAPGSWAKR
jgi:hypothetical protein